MLSFQDTTNDSDPPTQRVGDPLPELSGDATFPKSASYYEDANEDPWDDAPDSDADVLSDILAGREVVVEGRDEFIDDGPQAQCDEPEAPQPPELPQPPQVAVPNFEVPMMLTSMRDRAQLREVEQPEWRFRPLAAAGSSDDAPPPSLPPSVSAALEAAAATVEESSRMGEVINRLLALV